MVDLLIEILFSDITYVVHIIKNDKLSKIEDPKHDVLTYKYNLNISTNSGDKSFQDSVCIYYFHLNVRSRQKKRIERNSRGDRYKRKNTKYLYINIHLYIILHRREGWPLFSL